MKQRYLCTKCMDVVDHGLLRLSVHIIDICDNCREYNKCYNEKLSINIGACKEK